MSMAQPPRLPPRVQRALSGSNWSIVSGRRHWQIRIDDRLVAIWPHGTVSSTPSNTLGVIAAIRRARRQEGRHELR